jgi:hypothetical protein
MSIKTSSRGERVMQLDQTGRLKRLFAGRKGFAPGDHRRERRVRRAILALSSIVVICLLASLVVHIGSSAPSSRLSTAATSTVTPTPAATQQPPSKTGTKGGPINGTIAQKWKVPSGSHAPTSSPTSGSIQTQNQQNQTANALSNAPSGAAMPLGDLPGWHQLFTDDFTTDVPVGSFPSAVSDKWSAYPDGTKDTSNNGTYEPDQVTSVQNGILNVHLHTQNGTHMVAALLPKLPGAPGREGGLQYGRYVIRFKADTIAGYKVAWLLWPDSENWPYDGEIDFPESNLDGTINAFMHHQDGTSSSDQDAYPTNARYSSWHTAVIEWLPTRVTFILDGNVIGNSTARIPNTPMHWVIQTETALGGSVPSDSIAGNVQIDWVAVYSPE